MYKKIIRQFILIIPCFFVYILMNAQDINEMKSLIEKYRNEGDLNSEVQVLNKLAYKQWEEEKFDEASISFKRILEINKELNNKNGMLITIYNLGAVYHDAEKYELALEIYKEGITLSRTLKKKKDLVSNYINAAISLQGLQEYNQSVTYIEEALPLAKELNDLKILRTCYRILAENQEELGNSDRAIEYFDLFNTYDRRIKKNQMDQVKEESAVEVNKAHAEKRAKEIELKQTVDTLKEVKEITEMQRFKIDLLNKQKQIDELKRRELESKLIYRRKVWRITFSGTILLLMSFTVILFQFIQKRKANLLLANKNEKINRQNKQITDSITYAQTIQKAILPMQETINQSFNSFILFQPKDIVSGDFYWYSMIEEDKKWIVAVVDCTGHGVPGAFMSMIGNTLLNSIVNERKIYKPSKILLLLNEETTVSLKQEKTENRDGMDVCLCLLEKQPDKKIKMTYAGAKRSLLYYSKKSQTIKELKADRLSIGGIKKYINVIEFNDIEVFLESGDIIYLSSDGFIDQNAPDRKRYGSVRLSELLGEIALKPLNEQKNRLEADLKTYMNGEIQRDDITFIGLKI